MTLLSFNPTASTTSASPLATGLSTSAVANRTSRFVPLASEPLIRPSSSCSYVQGSYAVRCVDCPRKDEIDEAAVRSTSFKPSSGRASTASRSWSTCTALPVVKVGVCHRPKDARVDVDAFQMVTTSAFGGSETGSC